MMLAKLPHRVSKAHALILMLESLEANLVEQTGSAGDACNKLVTL